MTAKFSKLAVFAVILSGSALAQDHESVIELAISDGTGDDVVISMDSKKDGFRLHDMQLGESRSLTTADGRPVVVSRGEESFTFDVEGRQISMPLMERHEGGARHKVVRIMQHMNGPMGGSPDGVTIITPKALDDATRASISSALASAGMNDVQFVDISEMGPGPHRLHRKMLRSDSGNEEVRVIRKEVHVTN